MPPSNPNVPASEETVVTYQSIDLEAPSPAVTLPELNETVPNVSLSEELVASSTSTTHRYLFNETSQIEMFSVIFPAASHILCAAIVICTLRSLLNYRELRVLKMSDVKFLLDVCGHEKI